MTEEEILEVLNRIQVRLDIDRGYLKIKINDYKTEMLLTQDIISLKELNENK